MANVTIAPFDGTTDSLNIQNPERGSFIPDLLVNNAAVLTTQTLEIQCQYNDDIIVFIEGGGAGTATFESGDYPASTQAAKGDVVYTIAAGALRAVVPEAGRHIRQSGGLVALDGSILITVGGTGPLNFWVYRMPGGFVGLVEMNPDTIPAAPPQPTF